MPAIAAAPDRCRALIVVHPNNPTGSLVPPDDAWRLAELCRDREWALVADEVFLPYRFDVGSGEPISFARDLPCLGFTLGGSACELSVQLEGGMKTNQSARAENTLFVVVKTHGNNDG